MRNTMSEATIGLALLAAIAGLVVVVIVSGAASIPATGLRDLAILLGGALAGVSLPKGGGQP